MSNKKWGNTSDENKSQEQLQGRDGEDDEEFGEFEGFEGNGQFEPNMAQALPQALQPGMSAWTSFPDNVPSQRTTSSALQPDLLPMQANMHTSQMTDSNSSLGEASSFDFPDVSPHEVPSNAPGLLQPGNSPGITGASPLLSPSRLLEGSALICPGVRNHSHPVVGGAASHPQLALPDVSSREEKMRVILPDVRANLNGGQHLQGAIPRNRCVSGNGIGVAAEAKALQQACVVNGVPPQAAMQKAYLEEQLVNSHLLSQRLTTETEDLHQRVNDLEDQLSCCRNHFQNQKHADANVESIIQGALQRQRSEIAAEMQGQLSRLERTMTRVNAAVTEERLQAALTENNKLQLTAIDTRLAVFAEQFNETVRSTIQTAIQKPPLSASVSTALEDVLKRFTEEQQNRDAEVRAHILSCLESVLANGQQQLKVLLRPPGPSKDS